VSGLELTPEFAPVYPRRSALFWVRVRSHAKLAALLVGSRRRGDDEWSPAGRLVTVESCIVEGVSLPMGPLRDVLPPGDLGWPLAGSVRSGQTVAVFVRNDGAELVELRAVVVLAR
jgi:hypothetical protein